MDRMLFVSMSGAKETMAAQAINSNNLANASTAGFRADFESISSHPVYGQTYPSRVYASVEDTGVDFSQGSIVRTGRELDVAINGDGWFAVQAPDGTEAYTRAGDLRIDNFGQLTTGAGHLLLGNGGPIAVPPHGKLEIGADGTISIQPLGQPVNSLAVIDRIKLVNPPITQLQKGTDGLLRFGANQEADADAGVSVVSGSLESSNVNTVGAMIRMLELARQYEAHIKIMSVAEEIDQASSQIVSMN